MSSYLSIIYIYFLNFIILYLWKVSGVQDYESWLYASPVKYVFFILDAD